MAEFRITFTLNKAFPALAKKLAETASSTTTAQIANLALYRVGLQVQKDAVYLTPVDTGNLRASINTRAPAVDTRGMWYVSVGTNMSYAYYVEFGTGGYGRTTDYDNKPIAHRDTPWTYFDSRKQQFYRTSGYAPHPFLYPAMLEVANGTDIERIFAETVREVIGNV